MSEDTLTQRRQWFQSFPEGTIEFNLVTRVLAVGMMGALAILPESQHLLVINGLVGILWFDFLLMTWWVVQLGTDLETIVDGPNARTPQTHWRSRLCAFWAVLPTVPALLILSPWSELMIREEASRARLMRILVPVLAVCFIVSVALAMRALKRIRLAAAGWVLLWFVPVVHLFALHRIIKAVQARIQHHRLENGLGTDERHVMGGSLVAADVIWLLTLLPWLLLFLKSRQDSAFIVSPAGKTLIVVATVLLAVFSAVQLSLMERLQRQFLGLIRRKNPT